MIGKLVLVLLLAGTIKAGRRSSILSCENHQEDVYTGPFHPNGCPTDVNVHWLLRHDTYCSKFFSCMSGELFEISCMPGTFFDLCSPAGPVCDWSHNVDCGNLIPALSAEPKSTGKVLPTGCPADFSVHKLLPHETYCDKFYYCVFGEKVERDCAPGTYFNPDAYPGPVCDWPEKVDCGGRPTAPPPTDDRPAPTGSTTAPTPTPPPEDLPYRCPADFDVHRLLPHEYDCNRFYYCVHGEKVERQCPPGLYFNPEVYPGPVCDWPHKVECSGRT